VNSGPSRAKWRHGPEVFTCAVLVVSTASKASERSIAMDLAAQPYFKESFTFCLMSPNFS
jgi:hypothetical protein